MAAFVCLFAVGTPWSEREDGEPFASWASYAFGEVPVVAGETLNVPRGQQQSKFVTAISSRAGGNPLLKPLSALAPDLRKVKSGKPVGPVKISTGTCPARRSGTRRC